MPESELAQQVTKAVRRADKLVRDLKKDTAALLEAVRELKGRFKDEKDEDTK